MLDLAHAWHRRCLVDPVVSHPFSHPEHLERLVAYWGESLGGPPTYTETMGDETHVRRLHAGNGEHTEMDRRAVECFAGALADTGLADDERLRAVLVEWFTRATGVLASHPDTPDDVPSGLEVPRWTWDGPA